MSIVYENEQLSYLLAVILLLIAIGVVATYKKIMKKLAQQNS